MSPSCLGRFAALSFSRGARCVFCESDSLAGVGARVGFGSVVRGRSAIGKSTPPHPSQWLTLADQESLAEILSTIFPGYWVAGCIWQGRSV